LPDPRHFAFPFRFETLRTGRTRAVSTEQDTPEEIADCVEVCIRTVAGERATLAGFGRPDTLEFGVSADLARAQLRTAIDEAEPRARPVVEGDYDPTDPAVLRLRAMYELTKEVAS
jgi:hypothetical protein